MTNCKNCGLTIAQHYLPFRKHVIDVAIDNGDLNDHQKFFNDRYISNMCCRTQIVTCLLDPPMETKLLKNSFYKNYINYIIPVIGK